MPVPLLVPFDPRGRGCGVVARDSRKTGVVAPGDSCFIPHEARGEARVDGHGDWSPTSPSVPLSTHPDLLFAIEIIFPSIPGPRCFRENHFNQPTLLRHLSSQVQYGL